MQRLFLLLVMAVACVSPAAAGDLTITHPDEAAVVGEMFPVTIRGVADGAWKGAVRRHYPREGTSTFNVFSADLEPMIFFKARQPGAYILWVVAEVDGGGTGYAEIEFEVTGTPTPPPGPDPPPVPRPNVVEPASQLRSLVQPIVSIMQGHDEDGTNLAWFYLAFADVIERDTGTITSTGTIRAANVKAGTLMFQETGIKGKYAALAQAVDEALATHLGLEDVTVDPAKRRDAVDVFRALAWACCPRGGG